MSYIDTTSQLATMKNATSSANYEKNKDKVGNSSMDQDTFLQLMMTQLQYQDPLSPMGNTEFLAQQAQFTQISELQKLNSNFVGYNSMLLATNQITQASSMIGKEVEAIDPDDSNKTMTGIVEEVKFSADGITLLINGKEVSSDLVTSIKSDGTKAGTGDSSENNSTTSTDATSFADSFIDSILNNPKLKSAFNTALDTLVEKFL
ncbi:MAG: flagellar hook capping FlgD N-terminal domain-containing protein [Candidatus Gastranaerophilales bacterium]|nr:flagellar hook capping FlgD N-terminal domain-containing protein [Candidatus Gastranaerophilales bacterium]